MNWQWTPFILFLSVVSLLSFGAAGFLWYRFRHKPSARMGAALIFAIGWWMMGSVFELISIEPAIRLFWDRIQFIAIVALPPGWVMYALGYVGQKDKLTRRRFLLLWLIPAISVLMVYTNEWHHLFWRSYELTVVDGGVVKSAVYGPAFWVFMAYAYTAVFAGLAVLLRAVFVSGHLYRWQVAGLVMAAAIPWLINSGRIFWGWRPFGNLDFTPFALGITASAAGLVIYRLQLHDVGPSARHVIIEQMGDGVLVLDEAHGILDLNPAALNLLQRPKSQIIGRPITQFWPDWPRDMLLAEGAAGARTEWTLDGANSQTFDVRMTPLYDGRDQIVSRIFVLRDIGERKKMEEQIKASLHEKEALLKEIHHRVKNNLQIISSLLNLQSERAGSTAVTQALQEGQNRVRSMALIHENLYRSNNLAQIDFGAYVRELVGQLHRTYSEHARRVTVDVQVEALFLPMETAVPCGLILNELFSNAVKHAFVDGRAGQISIQLQSDHNDYRLTVADNGVGLPPQFDYRQTTTLGLQLVHTLVGQLDGRLLVDNRQGTAVTITFENQQA